MNKKILFFHLILWKFHRQSFNFLRNNEINQWIALDNFKDSPDGEIDWDKVIAETKTQKEGFRTLYVIDYNPDACSGFTLKMTNDVYVSVYGCCGK